MVKYIHTQKVDDDETIWRYMDFTSFYSLMSERALFFRRLDQYTDIHEGTIPQETKRVLEILWTKYGIKDKSELNDLVSNYLPNLATLKMGTLANSWTIGETESYAMWKIFLRNSSEGIAIKTTTGRLKKALSASSLPIILGRVIYGPLGIGQITDVQLATNKRKAYEYENEFRAVIFNQFTREDLPKGAINYIPKFDIGTSVEIDLNTIFGELYISPFAGTWFYDIVESVIRTFAPQGLHVTVMASDIKDK